MDGRYDHEKQKTWVISSGLIFFCKDKLLCKLNNLILVILRLNTVRNNETDHKTKAGCCPYSKRI
jgi:hypothetical protein